MNNIKIAHKNILSDPVTLLIQNNQHTSEEKITALSDLQQQYTELETLHKKKKNESKKISRQIGQAKRDGKPVDKLIQAMQQESVIINDLKCQIDDIASRIISYFEPENGAEKSSEHLTLVPPARVYKEKDMSDSQVSITLLNNEDEEWNRYVEASKESSLYHQAGWRQLIRSAFGHESYYFYARNQDDDIVGILPLIRLKSRLFGDFMVSMPYFNSGGAIANSPQIEQKLMQAANNHAESTGVQHIEYRDDIARKGYPVRTEKVNMILTLPDTEEKLWKSFSSKLRSQIRRAQREKPRANFGGEEYLNDFYTVFARNMRDLGTPVYSKSFFAEILQRFPEHSKIAIVHHDNRPVAAAFLLGYKDTLEIPWASTIKDVNHLSMNMLLYQEVLKFAIRNRYRYFDFGRSSKDSGTFRFKQQWGARPKQTYWHYWLRSDCEMPSLNPNNPKYRLFINIWKKLPVSITRLIGPDIVKNLP